MKIKLLPFLICGALSFTHSNAAELDGSIELGTSSNPLELSDGLSPESANFIESALRLRQEIGGGVRFTGKYKNKSFESDAKNADSTAYAAALDYVYKTKFINYRFDIEYNDADKTYVSKSTGNIGQSSGTSIPDRYDANWLDYRFRMDIDLSKQWRLDLNLIGRDKKYEDLAAIGLSNLDYSQWRFEPEFRYDHDKQNLWVFKLSSGIRSYDDRRAKDNLGIDIIGSQLEYDYSGLEFAWRYRPDKTQQYQFKIEHENRSDNESGYYDTTNNKISLGYRNKISKGQLFKFNIDYRDYSYDNNIVLTDVEVDEPIWSKEGFAFKALYQHSLYQQSNHAVWLDTSISYGDFDSVDANYIYDKFTLKVGISFEL